MPETPFGARLVKKSEALTKLQERIDKVLTELEKTPAAKQKIAEQSITRDAYGSGPQFTSADDLANLYEKIHTNLTTMWQTFNDQVEAFGLMALQADKNYNNEDSEQARELRRVHQARLREIAERTEKYYRDPDAPKHGDGGKHGDNEVEDGGA
ncbi:hypothetical protein [Streptomyces cucumeris]|uniref:hypothetical protein n=1 Tax=Streptomyces cucumeris TaxID=2962890 RepID=UPI003D724393